MTYLQLCQKLRVECGISGTGPATVAGQTGQLGKLVGWINEAWHELQAMHYDWHFMQTTFSFPTVAGTRDYAPADVSITDLEQWFTDKFLIYKTSVGEDDECVLPYYPYDEWYRYYRQKMASRPQNRPTLFTLVPESNAIRLEAVPDGVYTVSGKYKLTEHDLVDNADVPRGLPERFHRMIIYKAMMYYAFHQDAPEVLARAEESWNTWIHPLESSQLPAMTIGAGPVA